MAKSCSILLFLLFSISAYAEESLTLNSVVSVYDGDTFTVNIADCPPIFCHRISVRIGRIDTPEIRGKCKGEVEKAKRARDFLAGYLKSAKLIELRNVVRDKYFRIRADVFIDGIDIAEEMITIGLARPYHGERRSGWCGLNQLLSVLPENTP